MIDVNRIDFIALPVADLERSKRFFADTVGLPLNPNSSGERWVEYETGNLTLGLSTYGGTIALGVDDVDEATAKLQSEGVEFQGEQWDSGVCNGVTFLDPDGNKLVLHHRYAPLELFAGRPNDVQRTDFIGIPVTDRARAVEFYGGTLGLERNERAHPEWPEFEPGPTIVLTTPEQTGVPFEASAYSVALRVPDVAASLERLRAGGAETPMPEPYDSGVCHMGFFSDPDGNSFILHHRYAPYADGSMP